MIWIRADANSKIGSGHLMRCLSVAEELKDRGEQVCFLTADDSPVALLEAKGQQYRILHGAYDRMEEEIPLLHSLAKEQQPDLCLVDSYFVTDSYLRALGEICRTAYIDDLCSFSYPVDMVINYNIYGELLPYREKPGKENTRFLLGMAYVPLRREFQRKAVCPVREEAKEILITTGGSDRYNLAGKILESVLRQPETADLKYHVVSGAFNTYLPQLKELEAKHENICIHQNVTNMSELMGRCDIAITAGGSTMYELCAVGVPILCFSFVENQERMVEAFANRNIACYGGNYLTDGEKMPEQIALRLGKLAADKTARERYSRRAQELVDGRGSGRIAEALMTMKMNRVDNP